MGSDYSCGASLKYRGPLSMVPCKKPGCLSAGCLDFNFFDGFRGQARKC